MRVEGSDSSARDRLVEVIGVGDLSVPASFGRARERREREREGVRREEGHKARLERGTDYYLTSLSLLFYFNSCMSAPLSRMDCTFALIRCYNEMEMNLANTRLRFKCLELYNISRTQTNIYIQREREIEG